ncbi:pol polyprotein [Daphnia sinensis]|uniref:RNA-directed DNA polymerase n=1 Tax=Daphnia sinensis TaxID=1820382 RepID=A0AAD5KYT1_9CRUS|nr:pol polyprotein [Daphnia sinensis]
MQKKPNPRLPSCPRDPSRRLHPELSESSDGESTATGQTQHPEISTSTENLATSGEVIIEQSRSSSSEDRSESGSDNEADLRQLTHPVVPVIGQRLFGPPRHQQQPQAAAMAAVRKFISPPIFRGSPTEDARQWLERYETISTHNGNLPINLTVPETLEEKSDHGETYVFNLNPARLIKETVKCGKVAATALIDTGAAVTVISPELLEKTEFVKKPLNGPKIRLVNGQTLSPQSSADIVVTHRGITIKGNAIVMPMSGFELLLGNDFLQQFRAIHIDYESKESSFTTGKSPLAETTSLQAEQTQQNRLVSSDRQEIPAYTVKQIPAAVSNKIEGSNNKPVYWSCTCTNGFRKNSSSQPISENVTVKDSYPLPRIADTLSRLEGATFFSSMDLQSGYHQVPVVDSDRPKTAFITADGLYQFRTLPFGLTNAPGTFQRAMDIILAGLRWSTCLIYLDDVIIYSATFQQHLERLRLVLSCLSQAGLKLKWSKCSFMEHTLKVLGHLISKEGVAPDPEKLEAVQSFPSPNEGHSTANKVKRVQSFLGLCSYYRRHIQGFASIARPLTTLTKKEIPFTWGESQISSFNTLKQALTSAPVLAHPNYELPMEIFPDACGYGIGGVLAQRIEEAERPIAYASRLLTKSEVNYSITEKECLALVWCLSKFRCFVWGCKVKVVTDHQALCWLMSKRDLAGRLARWSLSLQEYDITIVYRSGKTHDNADCLSRNPLPVAQELEDDRCFMVGAITLPGLSETEDEGFAEKQKACHNWNQLIVKLQNGKSRVKNFNFLLIKFFYVMEHQSKSLRIEENVLPLI